MLNVPVYNMSGQKIGDESIDEALLGGAVNASLLKQAVVMYHANQRQGTVKTKTRAEVHGSSKKLYRQKGTGRARMGNARQPVPRDFRQAMPAKMRRLARNQAVLAKINSQNALIIDGLKIDTPKTGPFAKMLAAVQGERGCVFATNGLDVNTYKSGRNIPRTEILDVSGLNAFQILSRRKLIFTRDAFETFKQLAAGTARE
jgi:large subunit ribosomal protein L4